MQHFKNIN